MSSCAKTIIDLNDQNKITANEDILREILLEPSIKDKSVCVISITGTFRQGKSFLLNFLIRYLQLKYNSKKTLGEKWLDVADGNISGFPWKCGSNRHTTGILIWSEIYLAELPSGEEVAIVVLDTQGTFDNITTKQQCAAIFAIGTLISSVQIFNLKEKITQYDLEHLECFSGYGQVAFDQNSFSGPPFQHLCFLIRDWPYEFEYNFGLSGGQQLLNNVMNSPETVPPELIAQKENIEALFQQITCCLLPHPGETVAGSPAFEGNFDDIDPKFIQYVEEFVPSILAPENLVPKTVNGEKITAADLLTFILMYSQYFSSGNVPQLTTMYTAAAEAQLKIILAEGEKIYREGMDPLVDSALKSDVLEEHHVEQKQKIFEWFNNKQVLGNNEIKKKYKKILKEKLEIKFIDYRRINRIRQEKEEELATQEEQFKQEHDTKRNEMQEKLSELQNKHFSLEKQLMEERNKLAEQKLLSEIGNLKQTQTHQEELRKRDQELNDEKGKRHADQLAHQAAIFEEKLLRQDVEAEAKMEAGLHKIEIQQMTAKTEHLENEKNNLTKDKKHLTETLEDVTKTAEDYKRKLEEEQNKSGCIIV